MTFAVLIKVTVYLILKKFLFKCDRTVTDPEGFLLKPPLVNSPSISQSRECLTFCTDSATHNTLRACTQRGGGGAGLELNNHGVWGFR